VAGLQVGGAVPACLAEHAPLHRSRPGASHGPARRAYLCTWLRRAPRVGRCVACCVTSSIAGGHTPPSARARLPRASQVTWHPTAVRRCKLCGQVKPLDAFAQLRGTPYCRPECKPCRAKRDRERSQSDPTFRAREIARVHRNQQLMRLRRKHTPRPVELRPNPDDILSYVAGLSGVAVDDVRGPFRSRRFINARAAALSQTGATSGAHFRCRRAQAQARRARSMCSRDG
jgi:hypothetical protein